MLCAKSALIRLRSCCCWKMLKETRSFLLFARAVFSLPNVIMSLIRNEQRKKKMKRRNRNARIFWNKLRNILSIIRDVGCLSNSSCPPRLDAYCVEIERCRKHIDCMDSNVRRVLLTLTSMASWHEPGELSSRSRNFHRCAILASLRLDGGSHLVSPLCAIANCARFGFVRATLSSSGGLLSFTSLSSSSKMSAARFCQQQIRFLLFSKMSWSSTWGRGRCHVRAACCWWTSNFAECFAFMLALSAAYEPYYCR